MPQDTQLNHYFVSLVASLSTLTLQQLGKLVNPLSGKVERNLEQAKTTIDLLEMLKEKTAGNLTSEEENFLKNTLANLQLNYVDELNKGSEESAEKKESA